jgi:copper homeostasis protein
MILEVCCGNFESAIAAFEGGADRIELCSALQLGGLSPSPFLCGQLADLSDIPVYVMIRPRDGDFFYSYEEVSVMLQEIAVMKDAGASGIVSGAVNEHGLIDEEITKALLEASRPLPFTFHRAFDTLKDPLHALDFLKFIGCERVLTSGGSADAWSGRENIAEYVKSSSGKISIMAGAGINEKNARELINFTGVREIHFSGKVKRENISSVAIVSGRTFYVTSPEKVRRIKNIIAVL